MWGNTGVYPPHNPRRISQQSNYPLVFSPASICSIDTRANDSEAPIVDGSKGSKRIACRQDFAGKQQPDPLEW